VPVIPFIYGVSWDEYTTAVATGWPSAADPYASGSPIGPSMLEVALHLKPVKST
jgi:peptide/nickel transport system substrate-binding protein